MQKYAAWPLLAALIWTVMLPAAQAAYERDVMSEHIWTVALDRAENGQPFCEATAPGRTAEAGGSYTIRLRMNDEQPVFGVSYSGPAPSPTDEMRLFIDSKHLATLKSQPGRSAANQQTAWGSITAARFENRVAPALAAHGAFMLKLVIAPRVFEAPIFGFDTVRAAMNACQEAAATRRGRR